MLKIIKIIASVVLFSFALVGCGGGGGGSSSSEPVSDISSSVTVKSGSQYASFEQVEFSLDSTASSSDVTTVSISTVADPLDFTIIDGSTIVFSLPYLDDGTYTISVASSSSSASFDITVTNPVIADPKAHITAYVNEAVSTNTILPSGYQDKVANIDAYLSELSPEQLQEFAVLSDALVKNIDYLNQLFEAEYGVNPVTIKGAIQCSPDAVYKVGKMAAGVVAVTALSAEFAAAATASGPFGWVPALLAVGLGGYTINLVMDKYDSYLSACIQGVQNVLSETNTATTQSAPTLYSVNTRATTSVIAFNDNVSKSFATSRVMGIEEVAKSLLASNTQKLIDFFSNSLVSSFVPSGWVPTLQKVFGYAEPALASEFVISGISNSKVEICNQSSGGEVLTLAFCLVGSAAPSLQESFSFNVSHQSSSEKYTTYSATLSSSGLPVVENASFDVSLGRDYRGSLTGDQAKTFTISKQPTYGQLFSFVPETGEFIYRVSDPSVTQDSFEFFVTNEFGESNRATVTVNVFDVAIKALIHKADSYVTNQYVYEVGDNFSVTDWDIIHITLEKSSINSSIDPTVTIDPTTNTAPDGWSFVGLEWPTMPAGFEVWYSTIDPPFPSFEVYGQGFQIGGSYSMIAKYQHTNGRVFSKTFTFKIVDDYTRVSIVTPFPNCRDYKVVFNDELLSYSSTDLQLTLQAELLSQNGANITDQNYSWESDVDGVIGNAQTLTSFNLSKGQHAITVSVVDPVKNESDSDTINLYVGNATPFSRESTSLAELQKWIIGSWYEYGTTLPESYYYGSNGEFTKYGAYGTPLFKGYYYVSLSNLSNLPVGANPDDYSFAFVMHRITDTFGNTIPGYIEPGVTIFPNSPEYFVRGLFIGTHAVHWENGSVDWYNITSLSGGMNLQCVEN